ncbi:excisionase family DNA-binding protein [Nonomuraea sp. NPDC050404]|uniref:excisionase family DNA-binding protein n=1 Tax=Nonomuraea sp. NPDC050404 TaxID=3155783 RepID=UPI0033F0667E
MTSTDTATTPEQIVGDLIDAVVPDDVRMLEVGHVAKVLGVTDRAVLYLLQGKKLSYVRTGKRGYRIPRAMLAEYLLEGFHPRQLKAAQQQLVETQQAIQDATDKLASLAARITAAEAKLAQVDSANTPPQRRRSTQTVS